MEAGLSKNNVCSSIHGSGAMFPLIFKSQCAHKISVVLHIYLNSTEFEMTSMKYVQRTFLEGMFVRAPSHFVCSRLKTIGRG